jgi:hypothetical protein
MPLSRPVVISGLLLILVALLGVAFLFGRCDRAATPTSSATALPAAAEQFPIPVATPTAVPTSAAQAPAAPAAPTQRPAQPQGQTIVSFTVPATVRCMPGQTGMVHLAWSTANATGVTISIDGPGKYADYAASGAADFPFGCSETQHTYQITTQGAGSPATKTVIVKRA